MVMPGMLHLPLVQANLREGIHIGAQNCSAHAEGAFTGEVAADHLGDYRIENVLVGHHERRQMFDESQEVVAQKVKSALDCSLNVIYCVGESKEQRDSEQTEAVVGEQLLAIKEGVENWSKTVLVYEPLWAMGTGTIASADQTQESCELLRKWI